MKIPSKGMASLANQANQHERAAWIGILGSADPADLAAAEKDLACKIDCTKVLGPETGMLMVQAKADGSKARFNLGEVTVTKCILEINQKYMGASWIMGTDQRHARLAALFDGLLQDPLYRETLMVSLIKPLRDKQVEDDNRLLKDAEKTKVEFFTLKRGE